MECKKKEWKIMSVNPNIAHLASTLSEPSRAAILTVLLDGRFHTATELTMMIGVKPQTTSYHLNKLLEQNLIKVESQGRHRYFGIQNQEIANTLEMLLTITPPAKIKSLKQSREDEAVRFARTCYDHLAGNLGVQITDSLLATRIIVDENNEFIVTDEGEKFFGEFQINITNVRKKRRMFCHKCLDWSERRHHLGGALGLAVYERFVELNWVKRLPNTRALSVTPKGKEQITQMFSIHI
jgi:DNA-binding transcriptional ArsR family regulator